MLYKMVELKEGEPVQFLGVYVLKWQPEWGQPTCGFVEAGGDEDREEPSRKEWNDVAEALEALNETYYCSPPASSVSVANAVESLMLAYDGWLG